MKDFLVGMLKRTETQLGLLLVFWGIGIATHVLEKEIAVPPIPPLITYGITAITPGHIFLAMCLSVAISVWTPGKLPFLPISVTDPQVPPVPPAPPVP